MRVRVSAVAATLLTAACTGSYYSKDADREVTGILEEFNQRALVQRLNSVKMPEAAKPAPEAGAVEGQPGTPTAAPPAEVLRLDLKTTLALAVTRSRRLQSAREGLYLTGLGFSLTRFNYGPQFSSAISYVWGDGDGTQDTGSAGGSLGVSQLLPTNGTLSLNGGLNKSLNRTGGLGAHDWSTSTGISLSQPLLRGAGYDLYRENLTQAERSLVYSVRSFELFREDFTIDIAEQFFGLIAQKRTIKNSEEDLDKAIFDEAQALALKAVDRTTDSDVETASQAKIEKQSGLLDARISLQRAIEDLLIDLSYDPKTPVEILDEDAPYELVAIDPASAVAVAFENRLDLQSEREQLEDAERSFRLARDNLLPDVNLTASYSSSGAGGPLPGNAFPDTWSRSAGLSLEIPLKTIDRRNNWRQAEIAIDQSRREHDAFVDRIKSGIEDQLRRLEVAEQQIALAEQNRKRSTDSIVKLERKFSRGEISNRDLQDARRNLVNAQNGIVQRKVDHLISRLRLYRNLGILFIGSDGQWNVGAPPAENPR